MVVGIITNAHIQAAKSMHGNAKAMYRQAVVDIEESNEILSEAEKHEIVRQDGRAQYWNGKMIGIENVFEILSIETT